MHRQIIRTAMRMFIRNSDYGDFHAVDRRERIEETVPLLAAVAADPELSGRRPEIKRWRPQFVYVHRVSQHRKIAFLFWKSFRKFVPRVAAILAAPDCGSSARTRARHGLQGQNIDGVSVVWMHNDR